MPSRYRPGEQHGGKGSRKPEQPLDWATAFGYYGVAQVFGLGLPLLMLAGQSPTDPSLLGPVAMTAIGTTMLVLAAGRKGVLPGAEWPVLTNRKIGVSAGYWSLLRRHAHVTATLSLATFGGVLVAEFAGGTVVVVVAAVVSAASIATIPRLATPDRAARASRAGFYAAGLLLTAVVARPLDFTVGTASAPWVFLLLAVAAAADVVLAPPETDPRL